MYFGDKNQYLVIALNYDNFDKCNTFLLSVNL